MYIFSFSEWGAAVENTVFVKKYSGSEPALALSGNELRRYSGYFSPENAMEDSLRELYDNVTKELLPAVEYKVCYRRMNIDRSGERTVLPFGCASRDLERLLRCSDEIIIFAATAGLGIDRYIARHQLISPAKALIAQALGAERIETLCNAFCADMKDELSREGLGITPRYSPGYGDLPLEAQTDFFRLLDCSRQIGLSLNASLLMIPSKSVTAVFGITPGTQPDTHTKGGCALCGRTDCQFRTER